MIGYTPQEIDRMSIWQYMAAVEGYAEANSSDKADNKLSEAEKNDLAEWMGI